VGDVTAWVLLAAVVAVVTSGGSIGALGWTIGITVAFLAALIFVVRPLLAPVFRPKPDQDPFSRDRVALAVGLACASALATEAIGIHALFGGFMAGAILPAGSDFRAGLRDRLDSFSSVLLLPLFFAFTGLRTQIGQISSVSALLLCLAIIAVATLGKLGGTAVAARRMGMDWNNAFILGALMNTRGLMELIALNVGYDLGVISQQMFTVFVVMALVTTAMTGPLVTMAQRRGASA
jgi:Kef-type K+ transport system membrane component KefB